MLPLLLSLLVAAAPPTTAADTQLPKVFEDDFEQGTGNWQPTDPDAWRLRKTASGTVYSQFKKKSNYEPPFRSPYNMSLVQNVRVTDFVLDAKVQSTHEDYNHRDICLFFGYQDPAHFYYVHLGKKTDDHANQIFIVNGAPRTKISTKTTPGTGWDDQWHHVRIVRRTDDGTIQVYFDDMQQPIMTAKDRNFLWGRVGVGSFDDTGDWDEVQLRGRLKPADEARVKQ